VGSSGPGASIEPAASPNIVHAGAALRADWRTDFIHAQLPVIALDSGAAGAEIRVRIPQTNRIVRARILGPHTVAIIMAGA
jgi:flagella basal body P-ring formation protein FlgA